jgi:hypothetical protein
MIDRARAIVTNAALREPTLPECEIQQNRRNAVV